MKTVYEHAVEEGRKEGRKEGLIEAIQSMLSNGVNEEEIQRLLNVTDTLIAQAKAKPQ